jgi:Fis family transcriptional regulator
VDCSPGVVAVAKSTTKGHSSAKHTRKLSQQLASHRKRPLRDFTGEVLDRYFKDLNGHRPAELYGLVLGEVEPPLFNAVLEYTQGNQTAAAAILGISRATLRKKLKQYQLLN